MVLVAGSMFSACGGASTGTVPPGHLPRYEVTAESVGSLGKVLVDGHGYALYVFNPDAGSGRSRCYGICAFNWPPLVLPRGVGAPPAGPGVERSLLGVTRRSDGTEQVTYNGWPLYLWVNDTEPGQATGQGIGNQGGLWYVISPSGQPIR